MLILYDAHFCKKKTISKVTNFIALLTFIPIYIVSIFYLQNSENQYSYLRVLGNELINLKLQLLDSITTLIVYLIRIISSHVVLNKSDSIVFLPKYYEFQAAILADRSQVKDSIVSKEVEQDALSYESRVKHVKENLNQNLDPKKYLRMGILQDKYIDIDLNQTIYQRWPKLAKMLKSRFYNLFGFFTSFVSIISSLSNIPGYYNYQPIHYLSITGVLLGSVFTLAQITITCNIILIKYMLRSFEFWYIMYLLFKSFISVGFLLNWGQSVLFMISFSVSVIWCISIDSFHLKYKKYTYLNIFIAMASFYLAILCKFNIGNTFQNDTSLVFFGYQVMSAKVTFSTSMFYISLFLFRFYWSFRKNNNRVFFCHRKCGYQGYKSTLNYFHSEVFFCSDQ